MNNFLETLFKTLLLVIFACSVFGIDVDRLEAGVELLIWVIAEQKKDDDNG